MDQAELVTCLCNSCPGRITFERARFDPMAPAVVACPHCGQETQLYIPKSSERIASPPPLPQVGTPPLIHPQPTAPAAPKSRLKIGLLTAVTLVVLLLIIVGIHRRTSSTELWSTSQTVTNGNVEVTIGGLFMNQLFLDNGEGLGVTPLQGRYLFISLDVRNTDSKMKLDFSTWRDVASLSDEHGNAYKRIVPGFGQRFAYMPVVGDSIYPGSYVNDLLIFEGPVSQAESLYLQLPAGNFGGLGWLRFQVPTSRIR